MQRNVFLFFLLGVFLFWKDPILSIHLAYAQNYNEAFGHLKSKQIKPVTINNARGCENLNRCTYCSIADLMINTGNPKQFWDTVRSYHENFGINLFFEVYDSFTASPKYIDGLVTSLPKDLENLIAQGDIELMVYARALGLLKRDNIGKLYKIGVRAVNIGLDAGDTTILEAQRKNKTTLETNLDAISLLSQRGIIIHASFIAGALGETTESLETTISHIESIAKASKFSAIEFSRFIPLPNSPAWDLLVDFEDPKFYKSPDEIKLELAIRGISIPPHIRDQLKDQYKEADLLDIEELASDWFAHFTHIDENYAVERINDVNETLSSFNIRTGKNVG